MNRSIKTLIAFSFLMATIQPMQAATYTNQANKVDCYAWHAVKTASGILLLCISYESLKDSWRKRYRLKKDDWLELSLVGPAIFIPAFTTIKSGIDGLKEEWSKNQKTTDQK